MTKQRFAQVLAAKAGVSDKAALAILEALGEITRESIAAGNEVRIPGLGKIFPALRKERQVRNPLNGELMTVPPSYHVRFKATSTLKAASNR